LCDSYLEKKALFQQMLKTKAIFLIASYSNITQEETKLFSPWYTLPARGLVATVFIHFV